MKKSELKTGMIVVDRKDRNWTVMLGTSAEDILCRRGGWSSLDSFNADLTFNSNPISSLTEYDIMEVYCRSNKAQMLNNEIDNRSFLLWKREEFTKEQIQIKELREQAESLLKKAKELESTIK